MKLAVIDESCLYVEEIKAFAAIDLLIIHRIKGIKPNKKTIKSRKKVNLRTNAEVRLSSSHFLVPLDVV